MFNTPDRIELKPKGQGYRVLLWRRAPVFVLGPMEALCFSSLQFLPWAHTGDGPVCIQYSFAEVCECCMISCPARSPEENAHLACKSHPSTDALLALYWVAARYVLHILGVDPVTFCWKSPWAPKRSRQGTSKSSLKCNVCYVLCVFLWSLEEESFIFIFSFIYFSYLEIGPWLREFRAKNAVDFSRLTFDPGQKELVVGARWEILCFVAADNFEFRLTSVQLHVSFSAVVDECWGILLRMKYGIRLPIKSATNNRMKSALYSKRSLGASMCRELFKRELIHFFSVKAER